jgi:hypothetical protein
VGGGVSASETAEAAGKVMCGQWPWLTDEQRRLINERSKQLASSTITMALAELSAMAVRFAVENHLGGHGVIGPAGPSVRG